MIWNIIFVNMQERNKLVVFEKEISLLYSNMFQRKYLKNTKEKIMI